MALNEKKGLPLYLLRVLTEYSDEEHPLTQNQIIHYINNDYHVLYERKTISSSIKFLEDLNYDIVKVKEGIYLGERVIEPSQLSFIIDGLFSSRSISPKETLSLSNQLFKCVSRYKRKDYSYIVKSKDITKSNSSLFYNIDLILEAINKNKKISFCYGNYDLNKKLVPRYDGQRYVVSPYYLVNSLSRYYLLSKNGKYEGNQISVYRVDYIMDISIEEEKRENKKDIFGEDFSIDKYLNEHVYLFGGNVINAKIEVENESAIGYLADWFGNNVNIYKENDKYFAEIRSNEYSLFYWCLQYGRFIKVISPKSLVKKIVEESTSIINKYKI